MSSDPIVAGGGWVKKHIRRKPKAFIFGTAAVAWFIVDLLPFFLPPLRATGLAAFVCLRFAEWTAWHWIPAGMVAIHLGLLTMWVLFEAIEKPRDTIVETRNPNVDPHNYY